MVNYYILAEGDVHKTLLHIVTTSSIWRSITSSIATMIRALFICSQNRLRSPTAEQVFSTWPDVETDSAGLGNDAEVKLSVEQIEWATLIFVMEKAHRNKLSKKFKTYLKDKQVICLDIPDDYDYMQPELVKLLESKVDSFLR